MSIVIVLGLMLTVCVAEAAQFSLFPPNYAAISSEQCVLFLIL
jgi:hypothetical protein